MPIKDLAAALGRCQCRTILEMVGVAIFGRIDTLLTS